MSGNVTGIRRRSNVQNRFWVLSPQILTTVLLLIIATSVGAWHLAVQEAKRQDNFRGAVIGLANSYCEELSRQVRTSVSSLLAIGAVLQNYEANTTMNHFPGIAQTLIEGYRGISNLQLAPAGVVSHIHPLVDERQDNTAALGYAILVDPMQRPGAVATIENRRAIITGPVRLLQGGVAIIARYPVFTGSAPKFTPTAPFSKGNHTYEVNCTTIEQKAANCYFPGPIEDGIQTHFWGFATMVSRVETLLEPIKLQRMEQGSHSIEGIHKFKYQLQAIAHDTSLDAVSGIFSHSHDASGSEVSENAVEASIDIPELGINWVMHLAPSDGFPTISRDFIFEWILMMGLTMLTGFFTAGFVISGVLSTRRYRAALDSTRVYARGAVAVMRTVCVSGATMKITLFGQIVEGDIDEVLGGLGEGRLLFDSCWDSNEQERLKQHLESAQKAVGDEEPLAIPISLRLRDPSGEPMDVKAFTVALDQELLLIGFKKRKHAQTNDNLDTAAEQSYEVGHVELVPEIATPSAGMLGTSNLDGAETVVSRTTAVSTYTQRIFMDLKPAKWLAEIGDAESSARQRFERVVQLGVHEHWVIPASDVHIHPDCILGEGGFGIVCGITLHGSPGVMKISRKPSESLRASQLHVVANELRIMRRIRHPNIVLFFGACIDTGSGEIGILLEYVMGEQLNKFLKSTTLEDSHRHLIVLDICSALRYLHAQDPCIVHGDLKGSNILIEPFTLGYRARLLDFGLSRVMTKGARPLGGTLGWMAPEVMCSGKPSPIADVFSFGCLLFNVMTGRQPFRGMDWQRILRLFELGCVETWLDWPSQEFPFSTKCRQLCALCLCVEPNERPDIVYVHSSLVAWPSVGLSGPHRWLLNQDSSASDWQSQLKLVREASLHRKGGVNLGPLRSSQASNRTAKKALPALLEEHEFVPDPMNCLIVPVIDTTRLLWPEFQVTPESTKVLACLCLCNAWNFELKEDRCCLHHTYIEVLEQALSKLKVTRCMEKGIMEANWQCRECGVLMTGSEMENPCCDFCGVARPAKPSGWGMTL